MGLFLMWGKKGREINLRGHSCAVGSEKGNKIQTSGVFYPPGRGQGNSVR